MFLSADLWRPLPVRRTPDGHRSHPDDQLRHDREYVPDPRARTRRRACVHLPGRTRRDGPSDDADVLDDGGDEGEEHGHDRSQRARDVERRQRKGPCGRQHESGQQRRTTDGGCCPRFDAARDVRHGRVGRGGRDEAVTMPPKRGGSLDISSYILHGSEDLYISRARTLSILRWTISYR